MQIKPLHIFLNGAPGTRARLDGHHIQRIATAIFQRLQTRRNNHHGLLPNHLRDQVGVGVWAAGTDTDHVFPRAQSIEHDRRTLGMKFKLHAWHQIPYLREQG